MANCLQLINKNLCVLAQGMSSMLDAINNLQVSLGSTTVSVDLAPVVTAVNSLENTLVEQLNMCEECEVGTAFVIPDTCGENIPLVAPSVVLSTLTDLTTSDNTLYFMAEFSEPVSLLPVNVIATNGVITHFEQKTPCVYLFEVKPNETGLVEVFIPAGAVTNPELLSNAISNIISFNIV